MTAKAYSNREAADTVRGLEWLLANARQEKRLHVTVRADELEHVVATLRELCVMDEGKRTFEQVERALCVLCSAIDPYRSDGDLPLKSVTIMFGDGLGLYEAGRFIAGGIPNATRCLMNIQNESRKRLETLKESRQL